MFNFFKKKVLVTSGLSFDFAVTSRIHDITKDRLFDILIRQSRVKDYFSNPRIEYEEDDNEHTKIITGSYGAFFTESMNDSIYKEFCQKCSSFIAEQFSNINHSCRLKEGVMTKIDEDTTVIYSNMGANSR